MPGEETKSAQLRQDTLWYVATAAIAATVIAAIWAFSRPPAPPQPLIHTYYVWQKQWNDDVRNAVAIADADAQGFLVLAGEINSVNGKLRIDPAYPDWARLSDCRAPITIVLRANAALGDMLETPARNDATVFVNDAFERSIRDATANGVRVTGLQFDYDCPSSKLPTYAGFVASWQKAFGQYELSITVLPAWLKRRGFSALVQPLNFYVLQVHSIDAPKSITDAITLCDTRRIPGYIGRAASLNVPFYLALPTYGYRFAFDADGRFTAIYAEGPQPALKTGYTTRTAVTDPVSIAEVVRALKTRHPAALRGIAWFRLPVVADSLNWSWATLEAVRAGRTPVTSVHAEVRSPNPGLFEIWIANKGETVIPDQAQVAIQYDLADVLAFDTHNGFAATRIPGGHMLNGTTPKPGESVMAAWYRARNAQSTGPAPGKVELTP